MITAVPFLSPININSGAKAQQTPGPQCTAGNPLWKIFTWRRLQINKENKEMEKKSPVDLSKHLSIHTSARHDKQPRCGIYLPKKMPCAPNFTLTIGYGSKLCYQRSTLHPPTHTPHSNTTSSTEPATEEAPANLCCACHFSPLLFYPCLLSLSLSLSLQTGHT